MPEILTLGSPLPRHLGLQALKMGSNAFIDLPSSLIVMRLEDLTDQDIDVFHDHAQFGVSLCKTMMIVSLMFRTYNFDVLWSPVIAMKSGEPIPEDPQERHPLFNFALLDGEFTIRGLRTATISPSCGQALHKAITSLMPLKISEDMFDEELYDIFTNYPRGFPENFFHEICFLGD